ncbi:MAG: hypothetical protein OEW35_02755 [Gammaproteobacteria bacterium]|nr:hypothetical protein [Gammaproteobacteria bacterium]MDH4254069.1 hypothetical protein [Gammaproteobacteria bacterium]MDH5310489.1 hypothetical protein [Gammaproteobacteria bacterium]
MAILILSFAGGASAQTVDVEALRRCAALDSDEQKLACFERLADAPDAETPGDSTAGPVAAAGSVDVTPSAPATPAVPGEPSIGAAVPTAPAEPVPEAGPIRALAPGVEVDPYPYPGPQPDVEAAGAAEPAAEIATASEPSDDLGRRYIEGPEADAEPEVVTATVNEVSQGRHKVLYFHFANGQLWRQMEPGRFPYPKDGPFEVEIRQGMMGDYQLRVGGKGRMTRIVRVR